MQFSLERLFELIEQRFGRRVATAVLALVTLAIVAFSLSVVFISVVSPVTRWLQQMVRQGTIPASFAGVVTQVLWVILVAFGVWIAGSVAMRTPTAKLEHVANKLDTIEQVLDLIEKGAINRLLDLEERVARLESKASQGEGGSQ